MYIEFIWRNSQKKFKLIPTNNIPEKFQNLKKSYDSFEYTFDSKVYFHYVTKTIFLNLWEKNKTKQKKSYGTKGYEIYKFLSHEFETSSIRLDMNSKKEKSEKWQIEKIVQKRADFQPDKMLKVNKKSKISNKKKIFKRISILSDNNRLILYCFVLKINLI